jgi:tRNA-splicing ligase RtcB
MRELDSARLRQQIRTIGGGNHFLEVQVGDDGELYVMAHFGSRGLGAAGADAFEHRIRDEIVHRDAPADLPAGLLFAPADHPLGRLYFLFQSAMLDYAAYAHAAVQEAARDVLASHLGVADGRFVGHIPHNFIERREGAYWQRKGATPAYDHQGIPLTIPGSMATTSYLLEPGPNAERWGPSVPHGAGRVLSRGAARRALDQAEVDAQLARRGALTNVRHAPIDESAGAYKDVDAVVAAVTLSGVARVTRVLTPLLILKGA